MRRSHLEAICATGAVQKRCPIKTRAPANETLYDVPDTFVRNVIGMMSAKYGKAERIIKQRRKNDGGRWFTANQEAHAIEVLVFDYLRCLRREDEGTHYTLYADWKYSVNRSTA